MLFLQMFLLKWYRMSGSSDHLRNPSKSDHYWQDAYEIGFIFQEKTSERSRTYFANKIEILKSSFGHFSFPQVSLDFSTFNQRHRALPAFLLKWRSLLQHRNCNSESSELCEVKGLEFILTPTMKTLLSLIPSFLFFVFLTLIHNQREEEN